MPTPTRPVSGAAIASEWGQQVHDYTFAPAGATCDGGQVMNLAGPLVYRTLPIDTAIDDPGGYVDTVNNRVEIPADGGGLYLIRLRASTDEGDEDDQTRVLLQVNGDEVGRDTAQQTGGVQQVLNVISFEILSAGDLLTAHSAQVGTAGDADRALVRIVELTLVRIGAEFGAPS